MSYVEHKKSTLIDIGCKVITISDTRTEQTDKSGQLIKQYLQQNKVAFKDYMIVKDEKSDIVDAVMNGSRSNDIDVILLNGGTGIAKRDVTIEAVEPLFEKVIPGFGELFRMLSYREDIGSGAILSRAIAGTIHNTAIFCMPGSSGAVKLAMEKLILPELHHIVKELRK